MAKQKDAIEEMKEVLKSAEELMEKEEYVKAKRINSQYDQHKQADARTEKLKRIDFSKLSPERTEHFKKQNLEAFTAFRNAKSFIGSMFDRIVPFTAKELILILGQTGGGKTAAMSNIVWSTIKQKNPETGQYGKVLVISNEETETDILNRIACLYIMEIQGNDGEKWHYVDRSRFTAEQVAKLNEFIDRFHGSGLINIIGLDYEGELEFTCYLENIREILNHAASCPGQYDCIVLDYYQQIRMSLAKPDLNQWLVQAEFAGMINSYKEKVSCPIVIMAQTDEPKKDKTWKDRIVGTKAISQPCTFIMEACAKKSTFTTEWIIHKARYANNGTSKVVTGFKYGRVVPIDEDFQTWAKEEIKKRAERESAQKKGQRDLEDHAEKSNLDSVLESDGSNKK